MEWLTKPITHVAMLGALTESKWPQAKENQMAPTEPDHSQQQELRIADCIQLRNGGQPASTLTKREWFAGMILQGATAGAFNGFHWSHGFDVKEIIRMADTILDELERPSAPA